MNELNNNLRRMAVEHGLCEKWQAQWKQDWHTDEMVRRFYKGIDFYVKERFIPKDFIKKNFRIEFLRKNGIIVDDNYSLLNVKHAAIIGESVSTIRCGLWSVSEIYVFDNSRVTLKANTKAFVMVHAYDNAKVTANAIDSARIVVIRHSENCETITTGDVRVKVEL